jgi:hypothetical protein
MLFENVNYLLVLLAERELSLKKQKPDELSSRKFVGISLWQDPLTG